MNTILKKPASSLVKKEAPVYRLLPLLPAPQDMPITGPAQQTTLPLWLSNKLSASYPGYTLVQAFAVAGTAEPQYGIIIQHAGDHYTLLVTGSSIKTIQVWRQRTAGRLIKLPAKEN